MKPTKSKPYKTIEEILSNALISDDPKVMRLNELSDEHQMVIAKGRLKGLKPISVRWPDGQFAVMFCVPGTSMPSVTDVINAYNGCNRTSKTFPDGDTHETV